MSNCQTCPVKEEEDEEEEEAEEEGATVSR